MCWMDDDMDHLDELLDMSLWRNRQHTELVNYLFRDYPSEEKALKLRLE